MIDPTGATASAYDREFTYSRIGLAERREVWNYLDPLLNTPAMEVLELNCGTLIHREGPA